MVPLPTPLSLAEVPPGHAAVLLTTSEGWWAELSFHPGLPLPGHRHPCRDDRCLKAELSKATTCMSGQRAHSTRTRGTARRAAHGIHSGGRQLPLILRGTRCVLSNLHSAELDSLAGEQQRPLCPPTLLHLTCPSHPPTLVNNTQNDQGPGGGQGSRGGKQVGPAVFQALLHWCGWSSVGSGGTGNATWSPVLA